MLYLNNKTFQSGGDKQASYGLGSIISSFTKITESKATLAVLTRTYTTPERPSKKICSSLKKITVVSVKIQSYLLLNGN